MVTMLEAPELTRGGQEIPELSPADRALWDAMGDATPTFTSWPRAGACHDLATARVVAVALGTPLTPWQEWTIRVSTEWVPGPFFIAYRFKLVLLTVPRQAGKTTTVRTVLTDRALRMPNRREFYTAQTGKDATARWKDLVDQISAGPMRGHVQLRRAIGSQSLTFPNGSTLSPFAPTPKSLHGYTPHDVVVDEIFALDDASGNDLMGAIGPAQVTLEDRQLWLVSTMGTKDSTFLHGWVDRGLEITTDPDSSMAYLEWSMTPGLDPYDPESWSFHPALGHTITLESLADLAAQHSFGEWMRAFMNRRTQTTDAVIEAATFQGLSDDAQAPPASTSSMVISYEVAMDRSRSAIIASWTDPLTDKPALRVLRVGAGWTWLAPAVVAIAKQLKPRAIGADDGGPTRDATEEIKMLDSSLELELLMARDFATACDGFKARALADSFTWYETPRTDVGPDQAATYLAEAVAVAKTRTMGQGWAWDRMKSLGPIPELVAATVALRLLERGPAIQPPPMFREAQE